MIAGVFTPEQCGPRVSEQLSAALLAAPSETLGDVLVGGLLEMELERFDVDPLFADLVADRFHQVLRPLPNLLFMRDNAALDQQWCLDQRAGDSRTSPRVALHGDDLPAPPTIP